MRSTAFISFALLAIAATGCTSSMSFNVVNGGAGVAGGHQIPRAEVGAQGSGQGASVIGPGGHFMVRTTAGGSFSRRRDVAGTSYQLHGGVYPDSGPK